MQHRSTSQCFPQQTLAHRQLLLQDLQLCHDTAATVKSDIQVRDTSATRQGTTHTYIGHVELAVLDFTHVRQRQREP